MSIASRYIDPPRFTVPPGAWRPGATPGEDGGRDFDGYVSDGVGALGALGADVHHAQRLLGEQLGRGDAVEKKRSMRITKVQEESMANAAKMAEVKAKEVDEWMRCKCGQWVKTDFEG
ncbi:hypothetical protein NL676_033510 [Syzygium grande]|nr:hypothetical protein NL676_033510 [Syzygium grande]